MATHWNAAQYDRHADIQHLIGSELLEGYKFQGNERILDIGCGSGKTTEEIAIRIPKGSIVAIDQSLDMITFAKHNHQQPNIQYLHMDAETIEFNQEFDLILSILCIQWVADKLKVFKGIRQALKQHGAVLLLMPIRNKILAELRQQMTLKPVWKNYFDDYIDPTIHAVFTAYDEYAKAVGLVLNRFIHDTQPSYFSSVVER